MKIYLKWPLSWCVHKFLAIMYFMEMNFVCLMLMVEGTCNCQKYCTNLNILLHKARELLKQQKFPDPQKFYVAEYLNAITEFCCSQMILTGKICWSPNLPAFHKSFWLHTEITVYHGELSKYQCLDPFAFSLVFVCSCSSFWWTMLYWLNTILLVS